MSASRLAVERGLRLFSALLITISAVMLVWFRRSHAGAGEIQALVFGDSRVALPGIICAALGFGFSFSFSRRARLLATSAGALTLVLWF